MQIARIHFWEIDSIWLFYVLAGLAQQQLSGSLTRRTLWEFGLIASVALVVIFSL